MSESLVNALLAGKGLDHPAELIETHISWVVLAGDYVYKLKKPVDLGFLDFSSLSRRKHFCEEEVRLNRRTAPDIYVKVVPISGSETEPRLDDDTAPFEYAVVMRRFDNHNTLDHLAKRGELDANITSRLARAIAGFHADIEGGEDYPFSDLLAHIRGPVDENFDGLKDLVTSEDEKRALARLEKWSNEAFETKRHIFEARYRDGFVRECHGDLHLRNILYHDGRCVPFDCLEFDPELRWIDTASDIAFTVMDMESHGLDEYAHQLLIEYLERSGDYGMLGVLRYYLAYRAVVRAKVDAIRSSQDESHSRDLLMDCDNYLQMALRYTQPAQTALVMMCGLSGSGKTTIGRHIATRIAAIQIRSDVERKRLFGLAPEDSSHDRAIDIYTDEASEATFSELESLARQICENEYIVIVDATFIEKELRQRFRRLAESLNIPWAIVHCEASQDAVAERLAARRGDASEAGMVQYRSQQATFDEFDPQEETNLVTVNTESIESITTASKRLLQTLNEYRQQPVK